MPAAGDVFGEYELIEWIGRGAMGVVFKARQVSLDRFVALKILDTAGSLPPDAARRFRAEASTAAALRHPSIVAIHEVGVYRDRHYIAMDLIEGLTVAGLVARQPLTAAPAARLVATVAEAVQCAHERGILHRDLKPSNILVDSAGQPHVADFGLAKRLQADADLTIPGQVMGSPNFMSPEQARGLRVDATSDVHALGAILYFCVAGRPPFFGQSIPDTLHHVVHGEPVSLRLLVAGVPHDLDTIARKCLEKDPSRRYPDARALADDLRRFLRHEPIQARPVGRAERVWRWAGRRPALASLGAITSLLVLTVAIGSPVATWRIRTERERAQAHLYAADMNLAQQALALSSRSRVRSLLERHRPERGATDRRGFEWRYLWTQSRADERFLLQAWSGERHLISIPGTTAIATGTAVWDVGPPARLVYRLPDGLTAKAYDPREQQLLVGGAAGLASWSPATSELRPWLRDEAVWAVALSPDDRWMATGGEQLRLWMRDGGGWRPIASRPRAFKNWHNAQTLVFTPDGSLLVSGVGESWANRCELEFWSVPDLELQPGVPGAPRDVLSLAIAPDGRHLIAGCWSGNLRVWDLKTMNPVAAEMRHHGFINDVRFFPNDPNVFASAASDRTVRLWNLASGTELVAMQGPLAHIWAMDITADGRTLLTLEQNGRVAAWDATTRREPGVLIDRGPCTMPLGFSSDGQTLVTVDETGRLRYWDIEESREIETMAWSVDLSAAFTRDFEVIAPVISSDLRWLGIGLLDGRVQLWDLRDRTLRVWIAHTRKLRNLAFSPDGQRLATIGEDGKLKLWQIASGELVFEVEIAGPLAGEDFNIPLVWSGDGRLVAVGATHELTLHDAQNGRVLHRLDTGAHVYAMRFSFDGGTLVSAQENLQLAFWDTRTGALIERVDTSHQEGIYDLSFSPDGRTLVTVVDDVKLWSLHPRQEVSTLRGHERNIFATLFSPNGNAIVTADYAGAVRVWSALPFAAIDRDER